MPYCPKCDMEFIDGITVCSDCGGILVESRQVAQAMKEKEQKEALARMQQDYEEQRQIMEELKKEESFEETPSCNSTDKASSGPPSREQQRVPSFTHVYVKKSQQYEDLKSSASAFFLVGGALSVFAGLCWLNILKLPLGLIGRLTITIFGLVSLIIAAKSARDAKAVQAQIGEEDAKTSDLVKWFTDNYSESQLDHQLLSEYGELLPEELSLKRFDLIQDILITNHDLSDQSYVDLLAEDIYGKLFQD
ncbi:MAG: hypothetical protein HFG54_03420 [Lachnospiraceae bacterium]|nr:hypothetical protein [Lachnospiraceae bacterium]